MPAENDAPRLLTWLTALGDMARLRMLRLLAREELSVGELARAVQLPQSTVSRHLKLLHEGDWIVERTAGTASLYQLREETLDDGARTLWAASRDQLGPSPTLDGDDARLAEVLAERRLDSKTFFGRVGGEWDQLRRELFGSDFTTEALLGLMSSDWTIADLGCGTGNAAQQLAPFVKKVIAVDREPAMLDAARKRLASFGNVEFRQGDLSDPPLKPNEVNVAMIFLVMHHVEQPDEVVAQLAPAIAPGGLLMVVEMVAHDREDYRNTMGHVHLGFDEKDVRAWAKRGGLKGVRYQRLRPDTSGKGPGLFVATMRKPD